VSRLRRALIGVPLPTSAHAEERFTNAEALAILSSDALSSVAYATQEIVLVLGMAGAAALRFTLPITGLIVGLMVIVAISYRQTIKAYPQGGGSYRVSQQNLGQLPGLVAGASLSIDYVLTVAVSVAAGIAALTSYFPGLEPQRVLLCLVAVGLVMVANLRGVRSSAQLLSVPTYLFMVVVFTLLIGGAVKAGLGQLPPIGLAAQNAVLDGAHRHGHHELMAMGPVLLMRAFSSGCAALTGIEAISDSVAAFRPVEWRNARRVLVVMVLMLAVMFGGISVLAHQTGVVYVENGPTLLYQLGQEVFGSGLLLLVLQLSTLLILLLAANTAYADFPRLAAFLAQDGFLPRQLASMGDRLVFSNGILALSGLASLLLVVFQGSVTRLIPLYAVGVFLSFTFSQSGMVVHWWKERGRGWLSKAGDQWPGSRDHRPGGLRAALQQVHPGGLAGGGGHPPAGGRVPEDQEPLHRCGQAPAHGGRCEAQAACPAIPGRRPHGGARGPAAPGQLRGDPLCPHHRQRAGGRACGSRWGPRRALQGAVAAAGARGAAADPRLPLSLPGGSGGGVRGAVRAGAPQLP
jgi:amino acid transporter